jgi:YVTN family beta-propeller protein
VSLLDARSGALLRTVWAGRSLDRLAVDARRGRAFVTDVGANSVSVLDTTTGRLLRRLAVAPNPTAIAVDERTGRVFVASQGAVDSAGDPLGPGTLTVLEAGSGRLIGTREVGLAPTAVAVDGRTGAVFVVTAGGTVPGPDPWAWLPPDLRQRLPFAAPPLPRAVPGALTVLDPARA